MTYEQATAWIVAQRNGGARVRCTSFKGRVWLSTSTGLQLLVLSSEDVQAVKTTYQALQDYIDDLAKRTVSA